MYCETDGFGLQFKTSGDQQGENQGNYHNPTRQQGIYGDIGKVRQRLPHSPFGL